MSFQTSMTFFLLLNTEKNDILKIYIFKISSLLNGKQNIGRNVVTKPFKFPLISSVSLAHTLEVNGTRNVGLQIVIFYISYVFHRRTYVIQVLNKMRVSIFFLHFMGGVLIVMIYH